MGGFRTLSHIYTSYTQLKKYENENILSHRNWLTSILQFIRPTNTIRFNLIHKFTNL
jgi:hypothetical protein